MTEKLYILRREYVEVGFTKRLQLGVVTLLVSFICFFKEKILRK